MKLGLIWALLFTTPLCAAYSRYSNQVETNATLREVLVSLDDLKHEVHNHETEIRTFEEKSRNFEEIVEGLQKQVTDALQAMRDSLKNHESKLSGQEAASKGLTAHLQSHASDSAAALSDYKKRILELEKTVEQQNRNIENLQAALKSLTELLQGPKIGDNIYRVKAGDTLEKIAKQHQTTIKKLKELNGLTKDQINIGQKLQIPNE